MNTKVTFNYWLDKRRPNLEGKYPLKIAVIYRRQVRRFSVIKFVDSRLHYLSEDNFNSISNNKTSTNFSKRELTTLNNNLSAFILECHNIQESLGADFTFDAFKEKLHLLKPIASADRSRIVKYEVKEVTKDESFDLIDGYIAKLNSLSANSVSTKELYVLSYKKVVQYFYPNHSALEKDIEYNDQAKQHYRGSNFNFEFITITPDKLKAFADWTKVGENKISQSTVGIYLRSLRAVFNNAIDKGYIDRSIYPFKKDTNKKAAAITSSGRREQHLLDVNQINTLLNLSLVPHSRAEFGRDFYLISFLCYGANLTDILSFKNTNITNDYIVFDRSKTKTTKINKKKITIYIVPLLRQLMEKYKQPEGDLYFPFLNGFTDNAERKKERMRNLIKKMNLGLKFIVENFPQLDLHKLTGYDARYTFANLCKAKDMPYTFIQEALGHSNQSVTDVYLDTYPREKIREFTIRLFDEIEMSK